MENPITTMQIDNLRAQLEELRETCLNWSRCYVKLLQENEELREKIEELESLT